MLRLIVRLVVIAVAFWLTTLILAPHLTVVPYAPGGATETVLTYLLVAVVFGLVNGIVGTVVRIVAMPLYILTLGLLSLVVNALLLLLVAWLTGLLGFGLKIESFWWGLLGAIVLGIISWVLGLVTRPFTRKDRSRRAQ